MSETRGSAVPLVLSIIGAVLAIPNIMCAGVCGGMFGGLSGNHKVAETAMGAAMLLAGLPLLFAIVGGGLSRNNPVIAGVLLIVSSIMTAISIFLSGNLFGFIPALLFLIGGILSFFQPRPERAVVELPSATVVQNSNSQNLPSQDRDPKWLVYAVLLIGLGIFLRIRDQIMPILLGMFALLAAFCAYMFFRPRPVAESSTAIPLEQVPATKPEVIEAPARRRKAGKKTAGKKKSTKK